MQPPYRHLLVATFLTGGTILLLHFLLPYTLPFLLAALLAAVIDRPVDYLERRLALPRGVIVCFVLLAAVASGTLLLALVISNVATEIEVFYRALPTYATQWRASLTSLIDNLESVSARMPHPLDDFLASSLEGMFALLASAASGLLSQVQHLPNVFASLFIAVIATFFLSRDKRRLATSYFRLIPSTWHARLFELKRNIAAGSLGLVRGQMILFCITFTLTAVGFGAFGIRYAWLLGLLAAFLDVMPMVGPSGVFLPIIIHLGFAGEIGRAIGLGTVWIALLLFRQILEPRVMGSQLGVHPLTMIFTLYTGVKLFGLNGLWLGPFIVIAVKAVYAMIYPPAQA